MRKWKNYRVVRVYILAAVLCLAIVCLLFIKLKYSKDANQSEATTELFAMDTYITMTAFGQNAETVLSNAEDKLTEAVNRLTELEQFWSVTDPDSDIYAEKKTA